MKFLFFAVIGVLLAVSAVHAEEDCPKGVDPTYCEIANATGGKVIKTTPEHIEEDMRKLLEETKSQEKPPAYERRTDIITSFARDDATRQMFVQIRTMSYVCSVILCVVAMGCCLQRKYPVIGVISYGLFMALPRVFSTINDVLWASNGFKAVAWDMVTVPAVASFVYFACACLVAWLVFYKDRPKSVRAVCVVLSFMVFAVQRLFIEGMH